MTMQNRTLKLGLGLVSLLAVALAIALSLVLYHFSRRESVDSGQQRPHVRKVAQKDQGEPAILELTPESVEAMRLKTFEARIPRYSRILRLRGSLAIDSNRLSHVHARFPGQIVELATIKGMRSMQAQPSSPPARLLQNFDAIEQGIPMAVIWSKDLGEKKSDLANCLATLHTDRITLERLTTLAKEGGISNRELREQKVKVEQDEIAAFTAEATLRAYQVDESEIEKVRNAVGKIHFRDETEKGFKDYEKIEKVYSKEWPRVVVTAPIGGIIVNKDVTVGEIVDANANLFKIADLSVLAVWLHLYEEDLPTLEQLPKPLKVSIKVPAHPEVGELEGDMDRFSPMIDPNEHMALLMGTVKNPKGALLANQFITAEVGIPPDFGVVEIPTKAVIDFGSDAIAFVQPDRSKPHFQRRRVRIVQRYFDFVHVLSELTTEQKRQGLQEIHAGDAVISGGILELEDYLLERQHQ